MFWWQGGKGRRTARMEFESTRGGIGHLTLSAEFTVWMPAVQGQDVYVAGSLPDLGTWNVENAVRLTQASPAAGLFTGKIDISGMRSHFEYKYFKKAASSQELQWESRDGNRKAVISDVDRVLGTLQIRDDLTAIEVTVKQKLLSGKVMCISGPNSSLGSGDTTRAVPMLLTHGDVWKSPRFQWSTEVLTGEGLRVTLCAIPPGVRMGSDHAEKLWKAEKRDLTVAVPSINAICFEDECCKTDLVETAARVRRGLDLAERVKGHAEKSRDPEKQEVAVMLKKSEDDIARSKRRVQDLTQKLAAQEEVNRKLSEEVTGLRDVSSSRDLSKVFNGEVTSDEKVAMRIQELRDANDDLRRDYAALKIQYQQANSEKEWAEENNSKYEIHLSRMADDLFSVESMVEKLVGCKVEAETKS